MKIFKPASVLVLGCYATILAIDFGAVQANQISLALKYIGLICCVYCSFIGNSPLLSVTMLLTAVCDYILLFTDDAFRGVLLFIAVQSLHALRHIRMNGFRERTLIIPIGLSLVAALVTFIITKEALYAASAAYAVMLLVTLAFACLAVLRGMGGRAAALCAGGMILFLACDICVAIFNLGNSSALNWIWFFYLPSQWVLAASSGGWSKS